MAGAEATPPSLAKKQAGTVPSAIPERTTAELFGMLSQGSPSPRPLTLLGK